MAEMMLAWSKVVEKAFAAQGDLSSAGQEQKGATGDSSVRRLPDTVYLVRRADV